MMASQVVTNGVAVYDGDPPPGAGPSTAEGTVYGR